VRYFVGDRPVWMLETRTAGSRQRWIVNRLGVAYSRTPACQGERKMAPRARWSNRSWCNVRLLARDTRSGGVEQATWMTQTLFGSW